MKKYYTKDEILTLLKSEGSTQEDYILVNKVTEIHRALNTMDIAWKRNNRKFYDNVSSYNFMQI